MIPALQYLRHGKALCGKVFKRFVETFNYHNDFVANLKGDGDLPCDDGVINVDRTDPTHPVIRLNKNNLAIPAGGGGDRRIPGCFDIVSINKPDESEDHVESFAYIDFARPYLMVGGKIKECASAEGVQLEGACIVSVEYEDDYNIRMRVLSDIQSLMAAQNNPYNFVLPLYQLDSEFNVVCDFRNAPVMPVIEH